MNCNADTLRTALIDLLDSDWPVFTAQSIPPAEFKTPVTLQLHDEWVEAKAAEWEQAQL